MEGTTLSLTMQILVETKFVSLAALFIELQVTDENVCSLGMS